MMVFTYFENVPELNVFDELKLITAWRRNWADAGFIPFVLNEFHARKHPYFEEYRAAVTALPTTNPKHYEVSCWMRHLAMAQIGGGGILMDYDVFVYSKGDEAKRFLEQFIHCKNFIMFQERAPSLNCGPAVIYEEACHEFASGKWGHSPQGQSFHASDQYALEQLAAAKCGWLERRNDVKGYGDEGWEKSFFVHYALDPLTRAGKIPKWRHIPTLRK